MRTPQGLIPLSALAVVSNRIAAPFITREHLRRTINVTALNRGYTIKQVAAMARERLAFDDLPAGYSIIVAGAVWGLFLFDKPMCQPAMMGLILLGGTIVNNSILLIGFINRGMPLDEALVESVRLRIRTILMTTVSTILGLSPLVFEMAVGLERMSPLGIAAATGLPAGTFLTLVIVPVVYSTLSGGETNNRQGRTTS